MGYGVKLLVWGEYACFTRPELKAERVSYDVITPSAARGILEAIHYKPAIKWVIDKIHVINPIEWENILRNEVKSKISVKNIKSAMKNKSLAGLYQVPAEDRDQRMTRVLRNVMYVIEAHFELTDRAGERDTEEKHYAIFCERARNGRQFHQPYFGCEEFVANFKLIEKDDEIPESCYKGEEIDFGYMLYDINYENMSPIVYNAVMRNGIIDLTQLQRREVMMCQM